MASTGADARRSARGYFDAAEYGACLKAALEGLSATPDDVELLALAGRAGVEVDSDEAVEHLRRATELAPEDAGVWHHYGEALAAEGRMADADAAFRRAVELDPDDQVALTHLGHTALGAGRSDEGVGYLARAADIAPGASTAAISLVDMYRSFGQYDDALLQARRIAGTAQDDLVAWLDVAELSLAVGDLDEARGAFDRLRELDEFPGRETYPLHGLIQVEIRGEQWKRARELVDQTAAIEPHGLSADVASFLDAQLGGATDGPPPALAEVDSALTASLADYRRMLADDRRLSGGDRVG
jgi:Flp pilus assembly protein TadD